MKIVQCQQGTELWWEARRGVPTASCFSSIITPKTNKPSASQKDYICKLIGQTYGNQWPDPDEYISTYMAHGTEFEPTARAWYEFEYDVTVQQVGFCLADCGRYGCSPDGLVGDDGCLEIKCPKLETHARYLLEAELPSEHKCQVHGHLVVTGREWCDFVSYAEGLPPFRIRVEPDKFTALLKQEVEDFCGRYAEALEKIEVINSR